jgi:hypothetical protein
MSNEGFWPGYVAAMASLVQSLLLLMVILAFAIYQMSVLIGKRVDQAVAITLAEQEVQPRIRDRLKKRGIDVYFSKDVWRIDEPTRARIRQELRRQVTPNTSWQLWVGTDTEDAVKRRSAYLRLMLLRNELLVLGVAGEKIETRIHEDAVAGVRQDQTVHITPVQEVKP